MSDIPVTIWIVGGIAILIIAVAIIRLILAARRINLTSPESPDQQSEWMRTTPPPETMAATQADGEGITLYDHDAGEKLAAPFAEQIEDILRARLEADPYLRSLQVDLGTGPDGGLEIWVNGVRYTDIHQLPDDRLRQAFQEAIADWQAA
ncbi:MAG: hypothetical protein RML46_00395 [Anaerolineae bacterium]|nr:hypothetical protein [Anaerolineae bacterium]MDW8067353.1 hypothetical protein [Anaerolineae bacterium]